MPAAQHCGEAHGEVVTRLAQLERADAANTSEHQALHKRVSDHCNGQSNHPTRREVDAMRADLDLCSESVRTLAETVAGIRVGQAWWEKLLVPVVTAILVGAITWLKH